MKLPWKNDSTADAAPAGAADAADESAGDGRTIKGGAYTPGKGRPTPKRKPAKRQAAPPPQTRAEARARRKQLKQSMTKEEKRAAAAERRKQANERREAMMSGDERALLPRDKGPVRRMARNIVDARINLGTLFMPFAIVVLVSMLVAPNLGIILQIVMMAFLLLLIIDSVILGRIVNKKVRARYPDTTDGGFGLGFYAATRAVQMRRLRQPRPQVSRGDAV